MTDAAMPGIRPAGRASAPALFAGGILLGGLVIFAGNANVKSGENGGLGPAVFSAVVLVVLAAVLWYVVMPRVQHVDRTVVILSVVGVLSFGVFWLGVTPLLAAAAVAASAKAERLGTPAVVLRALAIVVALATVVLTVAQSHVF
jgi:hypothetical protein